MYIQNYSIRARTSPCSERVKRIAVLRQCVASDDAKQTDSATTIVSIFFLVSFVLKLDFLFVQL